MPDRATPEPWCLPGELWKAIPVDLRYEVSDFARARSLTRLIPCKRGPDQLHKGQILKTPVSSVGYCMITLGGGKKISVARAMLMAFVEMPPFEGAEARHLNDNRLDDRLDNLVWGSRQDNARDQERNWSGYVRRVKCIWGHKKVPPNLIPSMLPRLGCLACNRAKSLTRKDRLAGLVVDHQAISDQYYREIMEDGA